MAKDNFNYAELRKHLLEENSFVTSLINTIPPKMYFDQEVQEKLLSDKHSVMDTFAAGMKRKFPRKAGMTVKNKHKRARLDPLQHKSVTEIQQELRAKSRKRAAPLSNVNRAENIEQIKERMHSRIEGLRGERKETSKPNIPKKQRLEEKRKKQRMKRKKSGNTVKSLKEETSVLPSSPKPKEKSGPVYNKEGKMLYSKLDFGEDGEKESTSRERRRKKKPQNLKMLLHQAESDKEKIEALKKEDKSKAFSMIEKNAWHRAIQKAEGVKLKDDPAILKKSLKKEETIKKKRNAAWKARVEHTEKLKNARQDKRTKNIQTRKKEKRDNKIKRAKKKGRIFSGV